MIKKHRKLIVLALLMLFTLAIIIANVFVVTIGQYHVLSKTNLQPYVDNLNVYTDTLQAKRGSIYDRDGNTIATDSHTFNLFAVLDTSRMDGNKPAHVVNKEETARLLAPIIEMPQEQLLDHLNRDLYQTEFGLYGRNLPLATKQAIDALELPGIEFEESFTRSYPQGVFASNLIGLARYNEHHQRVIGQWGFESTYDDVLAGINGEITYQQDIYGYILDDTTINETKSVDGNSIYLTLDETIQEALEQAFQSTTQQVDATNLFGAVMEVKSGEILAWGQSPSYNPNSIDEVSDATFINYGLQGTFEPGSTFKAFTFAAAIDSGAATMDQLTDTSRFYVGVDENGNLVRSSTPTRYGSIHNYQQRDWDQIPYYDSFARSSNTASAELLTKTGANTFYNYLMDFGFTTPVNPDNLSDVSGTINYTYPIEKINTSFGQGVSVSVIQMLQAYSAILSDGSMVKPHFVDKIVDETGSIIYQSETEVVGHPIRETTARQLQDLMHHVVYSENGTATRYQIDGIDLIGKTGTSQIVIDGSYSDDEVIASVVLGFPYEDPEIMIYYGYQVPGAVAFKDDLSGIKNLVHTLSLMYDATHSEDVVSNDSQSVTLPTFVNHSLNYALNQAVHHDLQIEVIGNGDTIIKQLPEGNKKIVNSQKVFLLTNGDSIVMPDMTGWGKKDVINYWSLSGLETATQGSGHVVSQSIQPSEKVEPNSTIHVTLE